MALKRGSKKPRRSAECLVLHDSAGRPRVMIGMVGSGDEYPTFQLMDAEGRARVTIQVGPTGRGTFSIQEASGSGLIGIGADPDGDGRIGFELTRPGGVPVLSVNWSEAEGLTTAFYGHEGKPVWQGFEPSPAIRESKRRRAASQNVEPGAAPDLGGTS